jgi:hypothetical protein
MTTTAATTDATTYNGFRLNPNGTNNMDDLTKIVDDFQREIKQCPLDVTVCRTALSLLSARGMLIAFTPDQNQKINLEKNNPVGGSLLPALVPNRIGARHFTRSSRVRNLVHGGMTGLLAFRLMNDPSQNVRRWRSRTLHSLCVIHRVNGESGCKHLHWSIPEFQLRFNIGVKLYKTGNQHPYQGMASDELLARFNSLDTPENRQAFVDQCNRAANDPCQSRVMKPLKGESEWIADEMNTVLLTGRSTMLPNQWIMDYVGAFSMLCADKTNQVSNGSRGKMDRAISLVDLYRFMTRIDWIMTNPGIRNVINLSRLWEKYIERIIFMAQEGIEHSACILMRYFPEMMTPELHVAVNPVMDLYRVPQMEISNDDALFGPLKAQCERQSLLPEAVPPPQRHSIYSDSDDDDDYYANYHGEAEDDEDDDEDEDDEDEDEDDEDEDEDEDELRG